MECIIDKIGSKAVGGWSPRCYKLESCELIQYKKSIESFKDPNLNDKAIKKRYNLYKAVTVTITKNEPYVLIIKYNINNDNDSRNIKIRFNENQHLQFNAWFRILTTLCAPSFNPQSPLRPIPSNTAFTLYYSLQTLYKHKETISTQYIFQKRLARSSSIRHVKKLYTNLMVNHESFWDLNQNYDDIHLLSKTLIYTLENMPTSLFSDTFCKPLTDTVIEAIKTEKERQSLGQIKKLPEYMDKDILIMEKSSKFIQIKQTIMSAFSVGNKTKYKQKYGFSNLNRFIFLQILFMLLHTISNRNNYNRTYMNAHQLAICFKDALQSKQYLYRCKSDILSPNNDKYHQPAKDKKYEDNFIRMLKILIYYAPSIFSPLTKTQWTITQLIEAQGNEKTMTEEYNDLFSNNVHNEYCIPAVLDWEKDYGVFDVTLIHQYVVNPQRRPKSDSVVFAKIQSPQSQPKEEEEEEKYQSMLQGNDDDDGHYQSELQELTHSGTVRIHGDEIENKVGHQLQNYNQHAQEQWNEDIDSMYDQQDNGVADNGWLNCETCVFAPLRTLFGIESNQNNNTPQNNNQSRQQR